MEKEIKVPISELEDLLRRKRAATERLLDGVGAGSSTYHQEIAKLLAQRDEIDSIALDIEGKYHTNLNIGRQREVNIRYNVDI